MLVGLLAAVGIGLAQGTVGPVTFAKGESDVEPVDPTDVFSAGTRVVYAFFELEDERGEDVVGGVWYGDGSEVLRQEHQVGQVLARTGDIPQGQMYLAIELDDGAEPGAYRLELRLNGHLVREGRFAVHADAADASPPHVDRPGLTEGAGADGSLSALRRYPAGVEGLRLIFGYDHMTPDVRWGWRVSREGTTLAEAYDLPWDGQEESVYVIPLELRWDPGIYDLDLFVNGAWAASDSVVVGAPSPAGLPVLQADDFDDPLSGWGTAESEVGRLVHGDGRFLAATRAPSTPVWTTSGTPFAGAVIEVVASPPAGPEDDAYGIVVSYRNSEGFYAFLISSDGYYALLRREAGRFVWEREWTRAGVLSAIEMGLQPNRLRALVAGSTLRFYVNDRLLVTVFDAPPGEGQAGPFAASLDEPGVGVGFDEWRVWGLTASAGQEPIHRISGDQDYYYLAARTIRRRTARAARTKHVVPPALWSPACTCSMPSPSATRPSATASPWRRCANTAPRTGVPTTGISCTLARGPPAAPA